MHFVHGNRTMYCQRTVKQSFCAYELCTQHNHRDGCLFVWVCVACLSYLVMFCKLCEFVSCVSSDSKFLPLDLPGPPTEGWEGHAEGFATGPWRACFGGRAFMLWGWHDHAKLFRVALSLLHRRAWRSWTPIPTVCSTISKSRLARLFRLQISCHCLMAFESELPALSLLFRVTWLYCKFQQARLYSFAWKSVDMHGPLKQRCSVFPWG